MVRRLTERLKPYPGCSAEVMDALDLKYADNEFDAAFSLFGVLYFGTDSVKALAEMTRDVESATCGRLIPDNARAMVWSPAGDPEINVGDAVSTKKVIAVVGATGRQGGGLARAILASPQDDFTVRALTRNPESASARRLANQGAEVVKADLNDEVSLRSAFDGAHGAFVVTDFFAHRTAEQEAVQNPAQMEIAQARNAARAAKAALLGHVIWSTAEDTRRHFGSGAGDVPRTMGGYAVPHLDAKAEANSFFTDLGVPVTFIQTSYYYESLIGPMAVRSASGEPVLLLPIADRRLAVVAAGDIGRTALAIFAGGSQYIGETISVAGDHVSGHELADKMTRAIGEKVSYQPLTWDQMRAFPFAGAIGVANAFQYFAEDEEGLLSRRNLARCRELDPQMEPLDTWLATHKSELFPQR